jgi:hypothetical protein
MSVMATASTVSGLLSRTTISARLRATRQARALVISP